MQRQQQKAGLQLASCWSRRSQWQLRRPSACSSARQVCALARRGLPHASVLCLPRRGRSASQGGQPSPPACSSQQWQQRHVALLSLLVTNPPPALAASAAAAPWHPVAAATPLGLVSEPQAAPAGGAGGSILTAALGMSANDAPVSASLLVQAAAADAAGLQLLARRADAAGELAGLLQQYAAGVAWLLGGPAYVNTSLQQQWIPALQEGLQPPLLQARRAACSDA